MKKLLISLLFVAGIHTTSALSCVSITASLSRGSENAQVLSLQQFLAAKGYLKATPNGYFGPATVTAVKLYQKSVGLPQVGSVGPGTRAQITKDSCGQGVGTSTVSTTSAPVSQPTPQPSASPAPQPVITSLDTVVFFENAFTPWNAHIMGTGFSTSTNKVYFRSQQQTKYFIGTFTSNATGTDIILPQDIARTAFECGEGCKQTLPAGIYDVIVTTPNGGESVPKQIVIKSFTINGVTETTGNAIPGTARGVKMGTVSFGSPTAVKVSSLQFKSTGKVAPSGVVLKNSASGENVGSMQGVTLDPNQYRTITAYGDFNTYETDYVNGTFTLEVTDYISLKRFIFVTPPFIITVSK